MKNKDSDIKYCNVRKNKIESSHPNINYENLKILFHWISERYKIHLKKDVLKLKKPWTNDEILQNYKFTNVRREHDKETKWLIKNICSNSSLSLKNKILNIILFRLFNKSQTLELIGLQDFDNKSLNSSIIKVKLRDKKDVPFFSNAFYTSGPKSVANKLFKNEENLVIKIILLVHLYNSKKISENIVKCKSQNQVYNLLLSLPGIGKFLAYQIFVDLTYTPFFLFSENEFVIAGPGCIKGLNYIFEDFSGMNYEESLFWLRDNQIKLFSPFKYNPDELFSDLAKYDRFLNIMSLENCMCEISKYIRCLKKEGRPRIRYSGK